MPQTLEVDRAISFHYPIKGGLDNTVRLGERFLDIPPGPLGRFYAKARVEVRQLLDGSWKVYYQNRLLAKHPSTALQEPIRALRRNRSQAPAPGAKSYIKLPLNPFMTNHLYDKSKRQLREWVHQRLVGAASFPL